MFSYLPKPSIFAHRGSKANAPENTLAAFELAITHKADAIELDVKLCADGQVVVIHDSTVDRTTDGTGQVRKLSLAALKELDAGSYFDIAFRGEAIPTLEEVLEAVGKRIPINIELTNYAAPTDALPAKVAELVIRHGLERTGIATGQRSTLDREAILDHFARRKGVDGYHATAYDERRLDQLEACGYSQAEVIAAIDRAFDERPPDAPPIRMFSYCAAIALNTRERETGDAD